MLERAIKYLSESNCSESQLRDFLEKDQADRPDLEKHIEVAMERLHRLHLINDYRLAENITTRFSHKGNRMITQHLRQKKLTDEIIEKALMRLGDEVPRALDEVRKIGRSVSGSGMEQAKTKIVRFLSGRDFAHTTIKEVIFILEQDGFFAQTPKAQVPPNENNR